MSNCAKCFHPKENHEPADLPRDYENDLNNFPSHICTGSLECTCQHYEEPFLTNMAQEVEALKAKLKTLYQRSRYILQKIPPTRNAGEKSFGRIYREIWYGFKIRAAGTEITTEQYRRMPHDDSINREKRRVKAANSALQTYDPSVIEKQGIIYQCYLELAAE